MEAGGERGHPNEQLPVIAPSPVSLPLQPVHGLGRFLRSCVCTHPGTKPRKETSPCHSPEESRRGQSTQCSGRDYRCCPWQPASGFPGTQSRLK